MTFYANKHEIGDIIEIANGNGDKIKVYVTQEGIVVLNDSNGGVMYTHTNNIRKFRFSNPRPKTFDKDWTLVI